MKVWEAIEMLEGMDPNKEVTITIGRARKNKDEPFQYPDYNQPYWISPDWSKQPYAPFPPNTVTCKSH